VAHEIYETTFICYDLNTANVAGTNGGTSGNNNNLFFSLRHFGHLSHNCIKTRRNIIDFFWAL